MGQFLFNVKILATHLLSWRCPKFEFLFLVLAGLASMFVIASWNGRYLRKFSGFQFWQDFEILVIFLVVVFVFISIYECTISNREKWKILPPKFFEYSKKWQYRNLAALLIQIINILWCYLLTLLLGILVWKADGIRFLQESGILVGFLVRFFVRIPVGMPFGVPVRIWLEFWSEFWSE